VDEMRLVVEPVSQCNFAPMDRPGLFNFKNRLLKAHDLHVLPWGHTHLFLEQTDEMFLRIPDLVAELLETQPGWSVYDARYGILNAI
jgi:hypothetical protein